MGAVLILPCQTRVALNGGKTTSLALYQVMKYGRFVKTIDNDGTNRIYDLRGLKLQRIPERGVYIMNGKKYVKK